MNAFVGKLVALSTVWAFCELLLPEGTMQKMVRMTVSLLMMVSLVSAISGLLQSGGVIAVDWQAQAQEAYGNSLQSYETIALTSLANQVKHYVERVSLRAGYHVNAQVFLTYAGAVDHIMVTVQNADAQTLLSLQSLQQTVAKQLQLQETQIQWESG